MRDRTPSATIEPTPAARRPVIERLIDIAQAAPSDRDDDYPIIQSSLDELRRALPVAKQIILTGRVLDSVNAALDAYAVERDNEAPEDAKPGVERDAVYFTGLAVGLLLTEVL